MPDELMHLLGRFVLQFLITPIMPQACCDRETIVLPPATGSSQCLTI
ncbi:MAG TPA: hypothetical protein VJM81_10020 [Rhizorhapis sp.]|nr:hypothetical protein [Rhizorhapis sp.]